MLNRVFITGASGFIGTNLVRRLTKMNCVAYALVRKLPRERIENEKVKFLEGNILNLQGLNSIFSNIDTIFHCAAYISFRERDFQKAYRVNVEGTRNILETALKNDVKKVVHLSACAVLGYSKDKREIIDEHADPNISKIDVYAYTKRRSEEVVQSYVKRGLDVSIANIATVYGPGDKRMNSGSIIKAIYENKIRFAPPGGTSYVTVSDLVDGLILLAEKGKSGSRYIFCNENLTFLELINRIAKVLGRSEIKFKIPRWTYLPVIMAACVRDKVIRNSGEKINLVTAQIIKESYNYKYYSSQRAKDELGWRPKSSLEEAVSQAFKYYKKEGLVNNGR